MQLKSFALRLDSRSQGEGTPQLIMLQASEYVDQYQS